MSTVSARSDKTAAPPADRDTAMQVLEAILFVSDEPVTTQQIGQVLDGSSEEEIRALIEELDAALEISGRALRVEEVAGGYRLATRSRLAPWIRAHFRNRNRARLSVAAVETLAVIAYKQPITAPEIQEIRGVDPQGALKTLLDKRLVRIAGKKKVVGRPFLYATTREFLMHFGLAGIEDLPPIEDFDKLASALGDGMGDTEGFGAGGEDSAATSEAFGAGRLAALSGADDAGPEGEGPWEEHEGTGPKDRAQDDEE